MMRRELQAAEGEDMSQNESIAEPSSLTETSRAQRETAVGERVVVVVVVVVVVQPSSCSAMLTHTHTHTDWSGRNVVVFEVNAMQISSQCDRVAGCAIVTRSRRGRVGRSMMKGSPQRCWRSVLWCSALQTDREIEAKLEVNAKLGRRGDFREEGKGGKDERNPDAPALAWGALGFPPRSKVPGPGRRSWCVMGGAVCGCCFCPALCALRSVLWLLAGDAPSRSLHPAPSAWPLPWSCSTLQWVSGRRRASPSPPSSASQGSACNDFSSIAR